MWNLPVSNASVNRKRLILVYSHHHVLYIRVDKGNERLNSSTHTKWVWRAQSSLQGTRHSNYWDLFGKTPSLFHLFCSELRFMTSGYLTAIRSQQYPWFLTEHRSCKLNIFKTLFTNNAFQWLGLQLLWKKTVVWRFFGRGGMDKVFLTSVHFVPHKCAKTISGVECKGC